MEVTPETCLNPCFAGKRYVMGETCQGRIIADLLGYKELYHELYDGTRWYTVPKEVFMLWISAYNHGKESN